MSTTEPQTVPVLTVTWDTVIGARHVGFDPDSGPEVEPVSLGEMVVTGLVERLTGEIKRDVNESHYRGAVAEARDAATAAIQAETAAMVKNALDGTFQPMNQWGERTGKPTTLRDLVLIEVKKFLDEKPPRPGYNEGERPGGLIELLRTQVQAVLRKELAAEMNKARELVRAEVAAKAAELFGDVVKKATR